MEPFLFVEGKLCGFLVFSGLLKCDTMYNEERLCFKIRFLCYDFTVCHEMSFLIKEKMILVTLKLGIFYISI